MEEGQALKRLLKMQENDMGTIAGKLGMTRQNLNYHLRKKVIDKHFLLLVEKQYGITRQDIEDVVYINSNTVNERNDVFIKVKKGTKIDAHDALLAVLVAEVAALKSAQSGEPVQTIILQLKKAAENAAVKMG